MMFTLVEPKAIVKTNGEYFKLYCYNTDLCRINRMWLRHLDKTVGRDAPRWEKETEYDKWLAQPFDANEWDRAALKDQTIKYALDTVPQKEKKRPRKLV